MTNGYKDKLIDLRNKLKEAEKKAKVRSPYAFISKVSNKLFVF